MHDIVFYANGVCKICFPVEVDGETQVNVACSRGQRDLILRTLRVQGDGRIIRPPSFLLNDDGVYEATNLVFTIAGKGKTIVSYLVSGEEPSIHYALTENDIE